jgi:hypothetical protein
MDNTLQNDNIHFFKPPKEKPSDEIVIKSEKKFGIAKGQFILCGNCGNIVTGPEQIITVNDHHKHTFLNPVGLIFQIGCFSHANGCLIDEQFTLENTWFAGFSWSISMCSDCLEHLGWFYQKDEHHFFGLILDRLVNSHLNH